MGSSATKMRVPAISKCALVCGAILIGAFFSGESGVKAASPVPAAGEITQRVVTARAATHVASADVALRLYVKKPLTEPPNCTFAGSLRMEQGRPNIQLAQRSPGVTCSMAENRGIKPLFNSLEPLEAAFARFDLTVLDQKLVGNDHYYRVQGKARDPKGDPDGFVAWVDYDLGTIPEATINYSWGDMEATQTYGRVNKALVLTRQVLFSPKYGASLELIYSNFQFAPQ